MWKGAAGGVGSACRDQPVALHGQSRRLKIERYRFRLIQKIEPDGAVPVNGVGRRILRMSPIHHHFEILGWPESTILVRFWILSILFALLSLSTLKLR